MEHDSGYVMEIFSCLHTFVVARISTINQLPELSIVRIKFSVFHVSPHHPAIYVHKLSYFINKDGGVEMDKNIKDLA